MTYTASNRSCSAGGYAGTRSAFSYHTPTGGVANFGYQVIDPCPGESPAAPTGSPIDINGIGYILLARGTQIEDGNSNVMTLGSSPNLGGGGATAIADRNGNTISALNPSIFTDTLNQTALSVSGSNSTPYNFILTGTTPVTEQSSGASSATTTVTYTTAPIRTAFNNGITREYDTG